MGGGWGVFLAVMMAALSVEQSVASMDALMDVCSVVRKVASWVLMLVCQQAVKLAVG